MAVMARSAKRIIDTYLVAGARLGDRRAREALVTRYQPRFLRHAYRLLGDAERAKDAVQDGWVDIVRGLARLRDDAAFPAWAFRIVTRRCATQIAASKRSRELLDAAAQEPEIACTATAANETSADGPPVRAALAKLPVKHRAPLALFYLEDMTVAEIAVALDVPVGTVKTRLMHARRKLRAALEGGPDGQAG